jgi:(1->4)-alpha-D-glucan 1-alpha-D-glucosylmutase
VDAQDRASIDQALDQARARRPDLRHTLAFLGRVLVLDIPAYIPMADHRHWLDFVMRWQQLCGPVMAKGNEDTALYRYNCLLSRNEVGGHPDLPPTSIEQFHAHNIAIAGRWPHTINATSTHDTKRSEDTRARIAALSEMPEEWEARLDHWQALNAGKRPVRNAVPIPDANVEIQIYQSMLGAWPLNPADVADFQERLKTFMIKATREAKTYTNWLEPNSVFEDALLSFVDALFDREQSAEFFDDFARFHRYIARLGAFNSLSQSLIKFTVPGVPDIYQGNETWDFSLVDPDNRRRIDYLPRSRAFDSLIGDGRLRDELLFDLITNWRDGRIKLFLTHQLLVSRGCHPELYAHGSYEPCPVQGERQRHVVAYVRTHENAHLLVVAPVLLATLVDEGTALSASQHWGDTWVTLPSGWGGAVHDLLGGGSVPTMRNADGLQVKLSDVMRMFPGALLEDDNLQHQAVSLQRR